MGVRFSLPAHDKIYTGFFFLFFFSSFLLSLPTPKPRLPLSGNEFFYYSTLKSNVADFIAHEKDIDIIAPQTYEITAGLTASGTVPTDLYQAAQTAHVKVMPLIANHNFSQSIMRGLLASSTAQTALTSFLVSEAQTKGYIGWQFDFEHIASSDRDLFSAFVIKAAAALHAHGLILSIAVVAQAPGSASSDTSSSFYKNWSGAYDYASLASSTDFISLMTYDDPDSKGASAPLPFVKSVLNNILSQVPPSKISLGIPLFYSGMEYRKSASATEFRRHICCGNAKGKGLSVIPRIQFFHRSSLDNLQARSKNIHDMVRECAELSTEGVTHQHLSSPWLFSLGTRQRGSCDMECARKLSSFTKPCYFTSILHSLYSLLVPLCAARYFSASFEAIGPALLVPIGLLSIEIIGMTRAEEPHMKASSAM